MNNDKLLLDIMIPTPNDQYNRFKVALDIQDACNPSGVARELVKVIYNAMYDPECTGTDYVRQDAAVQLVIDKLHDLVGRPDAWGPTRFGTSASERCRIAAELKQNIIDKRSAS